MLERFGLHAGENGQYRLEVQEAVSGVSSALGEYFGYTPHFAYVQFTSPGSEGETLRKILEQRGADRQAMDEAIRRNEGMHVLGSAVYTGDIELGFEKRPAYMVFISNATSMTHFPLTLGEEFAHGEHMAVVVEQEGITYSEYRDRFGEFTEEFIGYLGRKHVIAEAGLVGSYPEQISMDHDFSESEWAHWLAYYLVDGLIDGGETLPVQELFHASSQGNLWQLLLAAREKPFEFNFIFDPSVNFDGLVKPLNTLLQNANAENAVKISFSHQEEAQEELE